MDDLFKIMVTACCSLGIAFAGFWLNQTAQNYKEEKARLEKLLRTLDALTVELKFYSHKLATLSTDIEFAWMTNGGDQTVPSYSIYPDMLQEFRTLIAFHVESIELVGHVGECHYELCHVLGRLDHFKEEALAKQPTAVMNAPGLSKLARNSIRIFNDTVGRVSATTGQVRRSLEEVECKCWFGM